LESSGASYVDGRYSCQFLRRWAHSYKFTQHLGDYIAGSVDCAGFHSSPIGRACGSNRCKVSVCMPLIFLWSLARGLFCSCNPFACTCGLFYQEIADVLCRQSQVFIWLSVYSCKGSWQRILYCGKERESFLVKKMQVIESLRSEHLQNSFRLARL
jgi:hypothetical protein